MEQLIIGPNAKNFYGLAQELKKNAPLMDPKFQQATSNLGELVEIASHGVNAFECFSAVFKALTPTPSNLPVIR